MTSGDQPEVWRMPNSGGGLPSPVPGMSVTSARHFGIARLLHRFAQEIVRDGKVEERLFVHWGCTLSLTWMSGTGRSRARSQPGPETVTTVSGPSGRTATLPVPPSAARASPTTVARSCTGHEQCVGGHLVGQPVAVEPYPGPSQHPPEHLGLPAVELGPARRADQVVGRAGQGDHLGEGAIARNAVATGGRHHDDARPVGRSVRPPPCP